MYRCITIVSLINTSPLALEERATVVAPIKTSTIKTKIDLFIKYTGVNKDENTAFP